jgi:hypothetical protein
LMNYDGVRGPAVLPKLQKTIAWWRKRLPDSFAAKDEEGRYYVIVDSLPTQTNFSDHDKAEIVTYMESQSDIHWIDYMVGGSASKPGTNAYHHDNVYQGAWGKIKDRNFINSFTGEHMHWSFQMNFAGHSYDEVRSPGKMIPQATHLRWMNISPSLPQKYPVIIDYWNNYPENLIFEPSTRSGTSNYNYLKWLILQQP